MKKNLSFKSFAITSSVLAVAVTAQASLITWQPSVDLVAGGLNDEFISTNGTSVIAFSGSNSTDPLVLNGVTFQSVNNTGTAPFTGVGGVSFTSTATDTAGPATFGAGELGAAGNADLTNLLQGAIFNGGGTQTLGGLVIGQAYEIQLIVNDARGGTGAGIRDTAWEVGLTDGVGTTIAGIADLTNRPFNDSASTAVNGDFIIGTFTADATGSQSFDFGATRAGYTLGDELVNVNNGQAQINGFQLRAVPEPSSALLIGLAGTALMFRRRK